MRSTEDRQIAHLTLLDFNVTSKGALFHIQEKSPLLDEDATEVEKKAFIDKYKAKLESLATVRKVDESYNVPERENKPCHLSFSNRPGLALLPR